MIYGVAKGVSTGTRVAAHTSRCLHTRRGRSALRKVAPSGATSVLARLIPGLPIRFLPGDYEEMECRTDTDCDPSGQLFCDHGYCVW